MSDKPTHYLDKIPTIIWPEHSSHIEDAKRYQWLRLNELLGICWEPIGLIMR